MRFGDPAMDEGTIVCFSGGLDSTVCLFWAKQNYQRVYPLFIDWRQKNIETELRAARKITELAGIEMKVVTCHALDEMGTPLTLSHPDSGKTSPNFVRQTIFLALAARYAQVVNVNSAIQGSTAEDPFPEHKAEFMEHMGKAMGLGSERLFRIVTPLVTLDKAGIVRLAANLPGCMDAVSHTMSCWIGTRCGECGPCRARAKGFTAAGVVDPAWRLGT